MTPERTTAADAALAPHAPPGRPPSRGEPERGSDPFGTILDQHQARTATAEGHKDRDDERRSASATDNDSAISGQPSAVTGDATPPVQAPTAPAADPPTVAGFPDVDALLAAASAFTLTAAPVIQSPVAQQPAGPPPSPPAPQVPLGAALGVPLPPPLPGQAVELPGQGVELPEPLAGAPAQPAGVAQPLAQPVVPPAIVPAAVPAPAVKPALPADQAPAAPDAAAQPAAGLPGSKGVVAQPQQQQPGSDSGSNAGKEQAPQQAPVAVDPAPQAPTSDAPQAQAPANAAPQAQAQITADAPQQPVQPAPQAAVAQAAPPLAQTAEPALAPHEPPAGMRLHQAVETVEAIVRMAQSSGVTRARVALHPEQLGGLEIHLRHTADGIAARVVADSSQAAHMLRGGGEELRRSLEAQGLNLVSFDVDTAGAQDERRSGFGQPDEGGTGTRPDAGPVEAAEATETIEEKTVQLPNGVLVDVLA